jgi:hypothetical protein
MVRTLKKTDIWSHVSPEFILGLDVRYTNSHNQWRYLQLKRCSNSSADSDSLLYLLLLAAAILYNSLAVDALKSSAAPGTFLIRVSLSNANAVAICYLRRKDDEMKIQSVLVRILVLCNT